MIDILLRNLRPGSDSAIEESAYSDLTEPSNSAEELTNNGVGKRRSGLFLRALHREHELQKVDDS